jgi:L-lactate dehydrogenase complex protein LldF
VFLQLLPRSSTGERMNPYTTLWTGVTPDDGPQDFHLVLLDNGRTRALADEIGRSALHCIRCSACLNVCPVYERTGGHAYGSVYPGPIGAILTPQLLGLEAGDKATASLPFASSLCGACYDACPVKIDIPTALVHLRDRALHPDDGAGRPTAMGAAMAAAAVAMSSGGRFRWALRGAALGGRVLGGRRLRRLPWPGSLWTHSRDLPPLASQSFRDWFAARGRAGRAPDGGGAGPAGGARRGGASGGAVS